MRAPEPTDLTGKTILITGSNAGIGKETAVALAAMGATVVMTARDRSKGEAALDEVRRRSGSDLVELGDLDLSSFASVRRFADWFLEHHPRLDVLVNNGGLITGERQETVEGFEMMFGVNHLGHLLLTDLLLDRLKASAPARVVVVASVAHRYALRGLRKDDLQSTRRFNGFMAYSRSKLANVLFARELAARLEGTGVTVNALHPGSINSHFGGDGDAAVMGWFIKVFGRYVLRTPEVGSYGSVTLASSADPAIAGTTGGYYTSGRFRRPARAARDAALAAWLRAESDRLVAAAS